MRSIGMSTSVCVSVCLSLCLSAKISPEDGTTNVIFTEFFCMLLMAVARPSSSGVVAIRYVLPVLWPRNGRCDCTARAKSDIYNCVLKCSDATGWQEWSDSYLCMCVGH